MAGATKGAVHVPESHPPLTPATFQILMALVDEERHGYAIMMEVAERSEHAVRLGAGTLYGTLKHLLEAGLAEEGGERHVVAGVLLLVAGIALLRGSARAAELAPGAAVTCLVMFVLVGLVRPQMSTFTTLLGIGFPIALLFLRVTRGQDPIRPVTA